MESSSHPLAPCWSACLATRFAWDLTVRRRGIRSGSGKGTDCKAVERNENEKETQQIKGPFPHQRDVKGNKTK